MAARIRVRYGRRKKFIAYLAAQVGYETCVQLCRLRSSIIISTVEIVLPCFSP